MEREPGRRGRPRKTPDTTPAASAPDNQPIAESPNPEAFAEAQRREELPVKILHRFTKQMFSEWDRAKLLEGLLQSQNEMFTSLTPSDCFQTLVTMTGIAVEEARERNDEDMLSSILTQHQGYKAALGHFNRADRVETGKPTDTSKLPPMTGSKG